jgi:hypothetical protein
MKMRRHPYTQHTPKRTKLHASHARLMSAEKPKRPLQPAEKETGPVFTLDQLHLPSCDNRWIVGTWQQGKEIESTNT